MKKQAGFTLIELVIVIIILGILAVTAAPKFLNLQDDARNSALKGMEGSLKSSDAMVFSKAVIAGIEKLQTSTLDLDGAAGSVTVELAYGYPLATATDLTKVAEINSSDWWFGVPANGTIKIYPISVAKQGNNEPTNCYVTYAQAINATTPPVITTTACQ